MLASILRGNVAVVLLSSTALAMSGSDVTTEEQTREGNPASVVVASGPTEQLEQALANKSVDEEEAPESAVSSPPMEMDDPGTPGPQGLEVNLVGTLAKAGPGRSSESLLDANYGIGERIQLKYERPYLTEGADGEPTQRGLGATELGVKWRFLDTHGWSLAVYPQYSFDDGFALKDEEGNPLESEGRSYYIPLLVSKVVKTLYTVAANVGYKRNLDYAGYDDINLAVGAGRSLGQNGRILAEVFSERTNHLDNRQTDVRLGVVHELGLNWLWGFASLGRSIGATEEGELSTSFSFGVSFLYEPKGE